MSGHGDARVLGSEDAEDVSPKSKKSAGKQRDDGSSYSQWETPSSSQPHSDWRRKKVFYTFEARSKLAETILNNKATYEQSFKEEMQTDRSSVKEKPKPIDDEFIKSHPHLSTLEGIPLLEAILALTPAQIEEHREAQRNRSGSESNTLAHHHPQQEHGSA